MKGHTENRFQVRLMLLKLPLLALSSLLFAGCIGPMLSHDTGRTLGKGGNQIQVASTPDAYRSISYTHGVTENLDLGIKAESLNNGFTGKYAFVNHKTGGALAAVFGLGTTFGGTYYMGGLATSYKFNHFEPFAGIRTTQVNVDEAKIKDADTGDVFATVPSFNFHYSQAFLGTKIRFNKTFGLSAEAASIFADNDVNFKDTGYISLAAELYF